MSFLSPQRSQALLAKSILTSPISLGWLRQPPWHHFCEARNHVSLSSLLGKASQGIAQLEETLELQRRSKKSRSVVGCGTYDVSVLFIHPRRKGGEYINGTEKNKHHKTIEITHNMCERNGFVFFLRTLIHGRCCFVSFTIFGVLVGIMWLKGSDLSNCGNQQPQC